MPFFDDSGPKPEQERNIFWRSISLVGDQLERMVILNIAWSVQSLPALVAWVIPALPDGVRIALTLYSAVAFLPATMVLFAALNDTNKGTPLSLDMAKEVFKLYWLDSYLKLLPLVSLFYWLWLGASIAEQNMWLIIDVLARLLILCLAVIAIYWGPLLVNKRQLSALGIFVESIRLFWRKPARTLFASALCFIAILIGVISIGGLYLIVPVLLALIQIQNFNSTASG